MYRFGTFWKLWGVCQERAEVLPPTAVGGHSRLLQHDGVVCIDMQGVQRCRHLAMKEAKLRTNAPARGISV